MTPKAYATLIAIVDGEDARLSREDASSILSDLWDTRGENGKLRTKVSLLEQENAARHAEADKLVAQVVAEEQRAVRAELERAEAVALVQDGIDEIANPKRWRDRARRWINARR